ncbi:MAG: MFS transporter, partial [Planctomycetales bacterium]|nr:MFS transporter [Planctomycetales bacterium]
MERKHFASRLGVLGDARVFCWSLYDWANSAYSTLIITVLIAYIQRVVFPVDRWGTTGAVIWAWGIAASMFFGAILSPILGAVADAQNSKVRWLAITAMTGSVSSILMGLVPTDHFIIIVVLFVVANLSMELSLGVYNGFLPEISTEENVNKVSAWGYGLGYIGGGVALVIAMLLMQFGDRMGLTSIQSQLRAGLVLMGTWWGLFTLPALFVLTDPPKPTGQVTPKVTKLLSSSLADVTQTLRSLRTNVPLAFFLLSFLFYNDGMQTIISQASSFALGELEMPETELMGVILMIQFVAMPGSIGFARIADSFGKKRTLLVSLAVWAFTL